MSDQESSVQEADAEERAEEERRKREAEDLANAKANYGPKTAILYDEDLGRIVIACRGRKNDYKEFARQAKDEKFDLHTACEQFARKVVVEPDQATLNQHFNDAPGIGASIAGMAKRLMEGSFRELGKD